MGWLEASNGYNLKKGVWHVALNRFLRCAWVLSDGF